MRLLAASAVLMAAPAVASAQGTPPTSSYPAQTVRMIVATAAGGGLDAFARVLARDFSAKAGQQFIVENRPGAGTMIASTAVARVKPDGYTVLVNTSAFAIIPALYQSLPYDPLRDFTPVTLGVSTPNMMVVHPSVPAKSINDIIALAKSRAALGDPILYASGGNGTNGHMATALFLSMAKIHMTHVPYRSGSLGEIDLIAGQVAMMTDSLSSVIAHVRSSKLRALGVSSLRRAAAAPNIPTIAESGVPGYESAQWYGLFARAGTPQDIIDWLYRETASSLRATSTKERLAADGLEVIANTPDEFATVIRADIAKWIKVVQTTG